MLTHVIYHIPGLKVGCSRNLVGRIKKYPRHRTRHLVVLEELHDKTNQEAGDIEWAWADRFGYERGPHYINTMEAAKAPGAFATMTDEKRVELGKKSAATFTAEERKERARKAGLIGGRKTAEVMPPEFYIEKGRKLGQTYVAMTTPEQRSEHAHHATAHLTPEQRSANSRMGGNALTPEQLDKQGRKVGTTQGQCPHCGLVANLGNLHRWHFDQCRHR